MFYSWLLLLLISYPFAYKYYRQKRMLSKNVIGGKKCQFGKY